MPDADLTQRLLDEVGAALRKLEASVAPGLHLPRTFGGHLVRSDARADLLHVLALLVDIGWESLAGVDLRCRAEELLLELDTDEIEGFYSHRVAESVARLGGLSALTPSARRAAVEASESPRLVRDIAEDPARRNRNFTVVAARCVHALEQLGVPADGPLKRRVRERTVELFASAAGGWVDDGRPGHLQFDIYTPEMYLLAEPFREQVGPHWATGLRQVLADLAKLAHPAGAIVWGRSVGSLASAMSLELSVLSLVHELGTDRGWWLSVGRDAAVELEGWFRGGLVTAHQGRTSDPYRGPARRLQLTFDLLGKMAWSARRLADVATTTSVPPVTWPEVDALLRFGDDAAVWIHRSRTLPFVLPLMAGRSVDYVASPRSPGRFEQPVDGFPLLVPAVTAPAGEGSTEILVPAGAPTSVTHEAHVLTVRHDGWAPVGATVDVPRLGGTRTAVYRAIGRSLEVQEHLTVEEAPQGSGLTLVAGEVPSRAVRLEVTPPHRCVAVDTQGMSEWRTHWSELKRVHQVDVGLAPRSETQFSWKVTPDLSVATTEPDHQYSRSLYDALPHTTVVPAGPPDDDLARRLRGVDVFHMVWPERWIGLDPNASVRAIAQIRAADVPIIWTRHNLLPHRDHSDSAQFTYALWAEASDGIIHHSRYGKRIVTAYHPHPRAQHYVIRHGHWAAAFPAVAPPRATVEAEEGWRSAAIRLAVVGQPRREKHLQLVVNAVAASKRADIQLVARLAPDTQVPLDPRIIPVYGHLDTPRYYRRLTAVDGIILPFEGDTMLTTGTAFDCIGGGIAPIASPWGFLRETFGDAAIWYDGTQEGLVDCLATLTPDRLQAVGRAARSLQDRYDWSAIGAQTVRAFEDVVLQGGR